MANRKWSGWYFSEELKFAKDNGYKISVKHGYTFDKVSKVFDDYVNTFYKTKAESTDKVHRNISKSLLNNLIGRFGLSIIKPVTAIVNAKTFKIIETTREIKHYFDISSGQTLVTFIPEVNQNVCKEFNTDYIKAVEQVLDVKALNISKKFTDVNIAISAAVNSYARIHMGQIKLDLLHKGYTLYYTDTDSLVVDRPIDDALIGNDLGKLNKTTVLDSLYVSILFKIRT